MNFKNISIENPDDVETYFGGDDQNVFQSGEWMLFVHMHNCPYCVQLRETDWEKVTNGLKNKVHCAKIERSVIETLTKYAPWLSTIESYPSLLFVRDNTLVARYDANRPRDVKNLIKFAIANSLSAKKPVSKRLHKMTRRVLRWNANRNSSKHMRRQRNVSSDHASKTNKASPGRQTNQQGNKNGWLNKMTKRALRWNAKRNSPKTIVTTH